MRFTGRKPVLTLDQYRRVLEIKRLRREWTNTALARELGVKLGTLQRIIGEGIKRYDHEIAKEQKR